MLRRLRLGNLRKLFRHRYGPILPDDDAGRAELRELLLPISVSANADRKMPKTIELWAPWMGQQEALALIDDINRTPIWQRKPDGKMLGDRLRATNAQRERLKLWTIAACDMSEEEARKWRKAKERERRRQLRQLRGGKSRAEYEAQSKSKTKPWLALGISRRTWERRRDASPSGELETGFRNRDASPSTIKLIKAEDTLASPEQAPPPKKGRAVPLAQTVKTKTPTKAKKLKQQRPASVDATATPDQRTYLRQVEPEPSAVGGNNMSDNKQEQDLLSMLEMLRTFLGNRATSGQWCKQMLTYGGSGWSKPAFKRRLKTLKHRKWIGIVGQSDADLERVPEGSLFTVTAIAPGASLQQGSNQDAPMSGAADDAAKMAMELLERINKTAA
jgi:hypothetical protein